MALVALLGGFGMWLRYLEGAGKALWRDETQFLALVSLPSTREMLDFLARHESHPPLYYLMARGWSSVAGGAEDRALLLPVLWGGATIVLAWLVGRDWAGRRAGLIAAASTAVLPSAVLYGGQVRPYAFLGGMVLLTTWLFSRSLRVPSLRARVGYVAAAVALIYTHHWMWLVLGGHLLCWVGARLRRQGPGLPLKPALWMAATILVAAAPGLPTLLHQTLVAGHFRYPAPYLEQLTGALDAITGVPLAAVVAVLGCALLLRARLQAGSPQPRTRPMDDHAALAVVTVPLASAALAAAASPFVTLFVPWCFSTLGPLAGVGFALFFAPGSGTQALKRPLRAGILVALSGWFLVLAVLGQATTRRPKTNAREVALLLQHEMAGNDLVIVMDVYASPSALRYLPSSLWPQVLPYPEETPRLPMPFDNRLAQDTAEAVFTQAVRRVQNARRAGGRVWYLENALVVPHLQGRNRALRQVVDELYASRGVILPDPGLSLFERFTVTRYSR